MNHHSIKSKLAEKGLDYFFERLEPRLRKSIRIQLSDRDSETVGSSRIGGTPDLPPTFEWPHAQYEEVKKRLFGFRKTTKSEEKPMSFIAQINLSEIQSLDTSLQLPRSGILYFFYDSEQSAWGFDPNDKTKFKVLFYTGDLSKLDGKDFPDSLNEEGKFKAADIDFRIEISLPGTENHLYDELPEDDQDWLFDEFFPDEEINKMGGYADNIQGEMELECELVTNGLFCGDSSGYNDPKVQELEPNAKFWRLLLQIDSNESLDMMWGDSGRLYFWIREQDLATSDFARCWMTLQCY